MVYPDHRGLETVASGRLAPRLAAFLLLVAAAAPPAAGQGLGSLVSPGKLAKAHAKLEGLDKCQSCHEPGRQVTAQRCLACHKPVAERIAAKAGVHRAVKDDCASCHVEHAGENGDLLHFETKGFDHKGETGFALTGLHAPLDCKACHKGRSFLGLKTACASCHKDAHNGTLGAACATCHAVTVAFKDTKRGFDHQATKYPLTGAHAKVVCEGCHKTKGDWRIAKFAACDDCHKNPHQPALGTCTTCHLTTSFRALVAGQAFDHAKTGYPLKGKHAAVPCASCHVKPAALVRLRSTRCADCHADAHRGVFPGEDCAACHTETGFKPARFDHAARTKFPLDGRHATTACAACHKAAAAQAAVPVSKRTVEFRGAKSECAACHADVHRGKLGASCQSCHGTATFRLGGTYRHPRRLEFFEGAHAGVACEKCHPAAAAAPAPAGGLVRGVAAPAAASREWRGVSFDCASCHKDPHLGQVGTDCARCHSLATKGYKADLFVHSSAKFGLAGAHATAPCAKCHAKETGAFPAGRGTAVRLTGISPECRTCHKDPHLGQVGVTCQTCHGTESFRIAKYVHAPKKEIENFFAGKHATEPCASCHKKESGTYPGGSGVAVRYALPVDCAHCHEDPHHGSLGRDCASCHNVAIWRTASRAFHKTASFPLEGKHLAVPCASCHIKGVLKTTPTGCYDCHWIRRPDDRFKTKLGSDCQTCHRPIGWTAVTWSHAAATGFALETPHRTLDCENCHKNQVFAGTSRDCYSCHRADYERVQNPNHVAGGFPTDCTGCHNPSFPTWQGATFTHSTFLLAGAHVTQPCASCHRNGVYKGTPRDCYSCHRTDYQNSKNPPHASAAFPTTCDSCHKYTDPDWSNGGFNHNVLTTFALGGVHVTTPCARCHVNGVYKGTPRDCWSCHKTDYQGSKNPPHAAAGFSTSCDACHRFTDPAWKGATFNHNTATTFALAGAHATATCVQCHVNSVFKGTPRDCYACHRTDFTGATTPVPHTGFPTTCDSCHKFSDTVWSQKGAFNHTTYFALAGAHATAPCAQCHNPPYAPSANNYLTVPTSPCSACHLTDYNGAKTPVDHIASNFPTTCDSCHKFSDATWRQATFAHTTFPLVGVHATTACNVCHNPPYAPSANNTTAVPTSCYGCHVRDFNAAVTPVPHTGFPTTCDSCHKNTDTTWSQKSAFNHAAYWQLAGTHATAPCAQCHNPPYAPSPNNYLTVPTSPCSACHMQDYNGATTPVNHITSNFPTTCDSCHKFTDATWMQATFAHTTFPLVGVHATTACNVCHNPPYAPSANNYATVPTSCYGCHVRDFNAAVTPVPHTGFPTTCDSCHKNTDSTWSQKSAFNHATYWQLAGAHATAPCAQCHNPPYAPSANNYLTVPTGPCSSCHMNDYNTATTPVNHITSNFPTTCDSCHKFTDATWMQATFSHTTFPLVGVHATTQCAVCHNPPYAPSANNYTTVPQTCYGCHVRDFNAAVTPVPHTGFPTTCDSCHKNTDSTWSQKSAFNHATYFALAGAHALSPCAQCHNPPYAPSANNYLTVPTSPCSACHMQDYNSAKTPIDHVASGFPTTCDACHKFTDSNWLQGTFAHTTFPLVGVHATTQCAVCHNPPYAPSANNYTTVPQTCYGCHVRDFNGATTPVPHTGFPTTCDSCHRNTDSTWSQKSAFNHSTYFVLAGAHALSPCAQCHNPPYAPSANNYLTVPTSPCSACHMNDFNNAKTPVPHTGFSTACDSCHKFTDATWLVASAFSHTTYFPLVSNHNVPCAQCHTTATNYLVFNCIGCHTAAQTSPPAHHNGISGYVWASPACYSCHPNGRSG